MLLVMFCFLGNKKQHKTNKNKQETTHMPPTQTSKLELFTEKKKKCQHEAKLFSLSKEFKKNTFTLHLHENAMSSSCQAAFQQAPQAHANKKHMTNCCLPADF